MRWTRDTLVHVGKRISTPHVAGCKALDTKSRGRDEVVDLAVEMTTTADAFPARGEAISAGRSGRDSVDSGSRSLARQTRSWRRRESCRAPRCRSFAAAFSAGSSVRLISIATPHVACASHKPLKIWPERMYIACAPSTSFHVIAVARNRIDHGDLLLENWK